MSKTEMIERKVDALSKKYRLALLSVGRSPDSYIEEVGDSIYEKVDLDNPNWALIMKVKNFYLSLNEDDQSIFYYEYLRKEKPYSFFYFTVRAGKRYNKMKNRVAEQVYEAF